MTAVSAEEQQWQRTGFQSWDFYNVPESIDIRRAGLTIKSFPAIRDDQTSVALMLCSDPMKLDVICGWVSGDCSGWLKRND